MLFSWEARTFVKEQPFQLRRASPVIYMQRTHLFWPHVKSGSFTKLIVCSGFGLCSSNITCQDNQVQGHGYKKNIKKEGVHVRNRESTYNNIVASSENRRRNIKSTLRSHCLKNQSIFSSLGRKEKFIELELINDLSCGPEVSVFYRPEPPNVEVVHKSNPFVPTTKWYECIIYRTVGANVEMAFIKFWLFRNALQNNASSSDFGKRNSFIRLSWTQHPDKDLTRSIAAYLFKSATGLTSQYKCNKGTCTLPIMQKRYSSVYCDLALATKITNNYCFMRLKIAT